MTVSVNKGQLSNPPQALGYVSKAHEVTGLESGAKIIEKMMNDLTPDNVLTLAAKNFLSPEQVRKYEAINHRSACNN
jgi:hypothetical protein